MEPQFPHDQSSGEPLHRQVRHYLEESIAGGRFADGRLPSTRELAAELGVSRNTVNLAYQELVAAGLVTARPRSGMVVAADPLEAEPPWLPRPRTRSRYSAGAPSPPGDRRAYRYPFVSGHAVEEMFPVRAWLQCLGEALGAEHRPFSLRDAGDADDPLLVQMCHRELLPGRGVSAPPGAVLVTLGSQQALHLAAAALVGTGTRVAVEDPGRPAAWRPLRRAGAELVGLPVDERGMVVDRRLDDVALVLAAPTHQYPTNVTLSGPRRLRLLGLAREHGFVIVEDDQHGELRYAGRAPPALASLGLSSVIYVNTFSAALAPGLRLGFMAGHPELIAYARELRGGMLRHPPGHLQRALALLIAGGEYRRSVRLLRRSLAVRWKRAVAAVRRHLPGWRMEPTAGGVSLWIGGPAGLDARALAARLAPRGVLIEPGDGYFLGADPPRNWVRLGFGAIAPELIDDGVALIAAESRALLRGR